MEQSVNTFAKGLQMDTNPMVQGSDTLSDALNATFVTMNGNEVILQNDMGNRRVDNAYLPPGYEPVGIKEYGGVIYIAAYNPITHKSQIGSFPSPERKIDINDNGNLQKTFDFDIFSGNNNSEEDSSLNNLLVLKNDSYLIPLTKDNTLHVGDKYIVYCADIDGTNKLSSMLNEISHYNNIMGDKVKSPKNKKYTIELGILDNQNSFHDLSKYLMRWTKNNDGEDVIIRNLEEKSDLYKNNVGYFIPDNFVPNKDIEGNAIDDTNFIVSRKQIAANTFSYKLSGPLYMRISYNHIQNFSCDIKGEISSNNKIKLVLTGYITYNCPDDSSNTFVNNGGDEDYYSYDQLPQYNKNEGVRLSLDYELFKINSETGKLLEINTTENVIIDYTQPIYNKIDNVYNVVLTKTYIFEKPENNIFEYVIGVNSGISNEDSNKTVYIRGLSYKGSLDLDLLNSGELSLSQYRFYNNNETKDTNMVFVFNSYPKEDESLENIRLLFTNIEDENDNNHYLYTGQKIINGQQVLNFNWKNSIVLKTLDPNSIERLLLSPLEDRTTYKVTIYYDVVNIKTSISTETKYTEKNNIKRWYLTTELFNDVYNSQLADFCNSIYTDNDTLFLKKITIAPDEKNTKVLYNVNYDDVIYHNPNITTNKESLYRVSQNTEDSLTLYLKVTMNRLTDENSQKLDNSLYPEYVGDLSVLVNGEDTITIINSETIQKELYELLDSVYMPLRTVLQQKNKVDLVVLFHTEADCSDDVNKCRVSYKKTSEWPSSYGINTSYIGYDDSYSLILYSENDNAPAYLAIESFENLGGIPDIKKYEKLLAKAFCLGDGCDDIEEVYAIGSCYLVKNNLGFLIFIKPLYIDLNSELLNFLMNWEEDSISSPNIFKIRGKIPELKILNKKIACTILLTTSRTINTIGNLEFNIDTDQKNLEVSVPYHNEFIIEKYRNYLANSTDQYIDMNTGLKMTYDSILKQTTSNNLFEVRGCRELIYCGNYTDIYWSKVSHYDGNSSHKGVAYSFANLSDPEDCALIRGRKKL